MIRAVTIDNFLGESVECVLEDPFEHGLNITSVDGITPEDINVVTQDLALLDGSVYSSSRAPEREISITFRYYPEDGDIEHARHTMYRYFGLGRKIRMHFRTDENVLWIDGYVKQSSGDIFSDAETVTVTVVCPDPWFRSETVEKTVLLDHINELDAFEFVTDYGHELEDRIEFGECDSRYAFEHSINFRVFNPGDRDIGCVIRAMFMPNRAAYEELKVFHIAFVNNTTGEQSVANLGNTANTTADKTNYLTFKPWDIYEMNSIPGHKMINFYRLEQSQHWVQAAGQAQGGARELSCPTYPPDNIDYWYRNADPTQPTTREEQMAAMAEWKRRYHHWANATNDEQDGADYSKTGMLELLYPHGERTAEDPYDESDPTKGKWEKYRIIPHLNLYDRHYKWFKLQKGWNEIQVLLLSTTATGTEVPWDNAVYNADKFQISIEYDPLYEGV